MEGRVRGLLAFWSHSKISLQLDKSCFSESKGGESNHAGSQNFPARPTQQSPTSDLLGPAESGATP